MEIKKGKVKMQLHDKEIESDIELVEWVRNRVLQLVDEEIAKWSIEIPRTAGIRSKGAVDALTMLREKIEKD
jgi:hypothetical protein